MTRSEYVEDFYKRDLGSKINKIKANQNYKEIFLFIIIPSLMGGILASCYINKNK